MSDRTCEFPGCAKQSVSTGLCHGHYRQKRLGKTLKPLGLSRGTLGAWIDGVAATSDTDGCLLWPFGADDNGYGRVTYRGMQMRAHQASLMAVGRFDASPDLEVCHNCGVKLCCNPRHLRMDTTAANMRDKEQHGTSPVGERHPGAILTEPEVIRIRELYALGLQNRHIAAIHGLNPGTVQSVTGRFSWAHVA